MVTDPDQVAFESAQKIAGMTGEYRSQVVAKIQVEVRAAMAALSLAPATLTGTVRPEAVAVKDEKLEWMLQKWESERYKGSMLPGTQMTCDKAAAVIRSTLAPTLSNPEAPAAPVAVDTKSLRWTSMPSYGEVNFIQLVEAVAQAIYADRDYKDRGIDREKFIGHQIVPTINFNSLNRIVSAFVRAALVATPPAATSEPVAWEYEWFDESEFLPGPGHWTPVVSKSIPDASDTNVRNIRPLAYASPAPTSAVDGLLTKLWFIAGKLEPERREDIASIIVALRAALKSQAGRAALQQEPRP